MKFITRTIRISATQNDFLREQQEEMKDKRGYKKSINQLIIDLIRQAQKAQPKDRPWN